MVLQIVIALALVVGAIAGLFIDGSDAPWTGGGS